MKKTFLLVLFLSCAIGISAQNIADATESEKKSALVNVEGLQSKLVLNVKQKEQMLSWLRKCLRLPRYKLQNK